MEELEVPKDAGKDEAGEVRRWLIEIELADKREKQWRKDVKEVLKIFRSDRFTGDESEKRKETFNILWSNTEIKRPSLYNSLPRPDIRRRYRDKDSLGKHISELMERCATYTLDCQEFDTIMIAAVNDMLLPGRALTRVRYVPSFSQNETEGEEDDQLDYEEVVYEQIQWDDFRHGPGKTWDEVPWESFDHKLTKTEMEERFKAFADKVNYDVSVTEDQSKELDDTSLSAFKRCLVHEIWDKDKREVIFVAPSYKDSVIGRESDPLGLKHFFPNPRPLYAIESSTSLIPIPEYTMYETLARELENVTNRIRRILGALRVRGISDATITELEKLFEADDNKIIPSTDISRFIQAGGLEKVIWMLPVDIYASVLGKLYEYRNSLIQQIYEITGISDIIRGATNPNETLGAQEIKANFGTQRLQRQQREVQRYARDLVRLSVELMAENFSRQTLTLMSGLSFPTMEDKRRAQMIISSIQQQAQIAQMQLQSLPPEQQQQYMQVMEKKKQQAEMQMQQAQAVLEQPSWEEIEEILNSDMLREFRIDIETDSTIQSQQQEDQRNITELLAGIAKFMNEMAPAVQTGVLSMEAAKKLLMSAVRRFKLGREVEDALEELGKPQTGVNQSEQQEMKLQQMEMAQKEAEHQFKMAEMQRKEELDKAKFQQEMTKIQQEMQKLQYESMGMVA